MSGDNGGAALSDLIKAACDAVRKPYYAAERGQVEALLDVALVALDHAHTYQVEQERETERARRTEK